MRSTRMKYCCTVMRNEHGFRVQFGLAEAFDLFLECADHRELQAVDLDRLPSAALWLP